MKKIIYGIPDKPDLGDTLLLTPLFKHNPGTMEFNRTARGAQISELFRGLCDIKFVDKVKSEIEYFTEYGDINKRDVPSLTHACKHYAKIFGVETDDFIPYIHLFDQDKLFADKFVEGLRDPITIAPVAGGFGMGNDNLMMTKMLSIDHWNELTAHISKHHDILYFSSSSKNFPINNVINMSDLTVREMCAIMNRCKKNISIENGILHAAVASGAKVFALVSGFGWNPCNYFPNYGYTDDMWNKEEKRVFYFTLPHYKKILDYF